MVSKYEKFTRRNWLWLLVNLLVLALVLRTGQMVFHTPYSDQWVLFAANADSAREAVQFSGMTALILLVLSLACTPVASILKFRKAITVRKSLGLWAFGFALFHALFLVGNKAIFTEFEAWQGIWRVAKVSFSTGPWGKMPYARVGVFALVLLIPLALTSNRASMRRLGKSWKRLHRLVYLAVALAVWHYLWRTDHLKQWGVPSGKAEEIDWWQPILFVVAVALLLLVRIPRVRNRVLHIVRIERRER